MAAATHLMKLSIIDKLLSGRSSHTAFENFGQGMLALFVLFVGCGGGLLIYSAYLYAGSKFLPPVAASMIGGLSLCLALIVAALAYLAHCYRLSQLKKMQVGLKAKLQSVLGALDEEFGETIRDNPMLAVTLAAAAGYLLEERI